MATVDYWIQLENRPWDVAPHNVDRITGQDLKQREKKDPVDNVQLVSPGTGKTRKVKMFRPLRKTGGAVGARLSRVRR